MYVERIKLPNTQDYLENDLEVVPDLDFSWNSESSIYTADKQYKDEIQNVIKDFDSKTYINNQEQRTLLDCYRIERRDYGE